MYDLIFSQPTPGRLKKLGFSLSSILKRYCRYPPGCMTYRCEHQQENTIPGAIITYYYAGMPSCRW